MLNIFAILFYFYRYTFSYVFKFAKNRSIIMDARERETERQEEVIDSYFS